MTVIENNLAFWNTKVDKDQRHFSIDRVLDPAQVLTYVASWPLCIHLMAAVFCLGCSTLYHLMGITSKTVNEILCRLDYGGIAILIAGSAFPPNTYVFACNEVIVSRMFYLGLISVSSSICFVVSILPFFNKPEFRAVRGFMFIFLGLSAGIPFIYVSYLTGTE